MSPCTPCLQLTLPTSGHVRDFNPLEIAHAEHTTKYQKNVSQALNGLAKPIARPSGIKLCGKKASTVMQLNETLI